MRLFIIASILMLAPSARATPAAVMAAARGAAGGGGAAAPPQPKPGAISGRAVLAPGIPATSCRVSLEGASLSAGCNSNGAFMLKDVQPGQYELRINVPNVGEARLQTGVGEGQATYVGDVTVGVPGAVMGVVTAATSSDLDLTVVGIPELGLYTTPNISGAYLLTGVPGGTWNVTLYPPGQSAVSRSVTVPAGQGVNKVDFQIPPPVMPKR
jgi:hypothetical protein